MSMPGASASNWDPWLQRALKAARAGTDALRSARAEARIVETKSAPGDFVTTADVASNEAILEVVDASDTQVGLVCEDHPDRPSDTGLRWVVDAVDGTGNLALGIPHFAVSIALEERVEDGWEPRVGVVHDPNRDEVFWAVDGGGAWLGDTRLSIRPPCPVDDAVVATEYAYTAEGRTRQARNLTALLPAVRSVRSTGSSALDLAWVAAGRLDAFLEDELERWDWAAGALISREAGAECTPWGTGVLCAGPALAAELRALITTEEF
ncbi:inositol monophosphatase family protein [Streptomyces antimicrobicus]|uniref:Inositol-1-monophosphatase n=1 Tax=Streptomyces antimicrobicus TaxID=2883108 RepID=A0ABS8B102_9ACTN|nr:inositol monophosphatase family protein [Streptomyces antimicrobicus]MCB5178255.1 inositol monophosphatase [Streptomyces antimicrobicus]